jgi:hypothetical protein
LITNLFNYIILLGGGIVFDGIPDIGRIFQVKGVPSGIGKGVSPAVMEGKYEAIDLFGSVTGKLCGIRPALGTVFLLVRKCGSSCAKDNRSGGAPYRSKNLQKELARQAFLKN